MLKRKIYTGLILLVFMITVVIISITPLPLFAMPQLFTRIEEEDADPSVSATKIKVGNGLLTDNGDGSVSVAGIESSPINITINKADPSIIFDPATATDTEFWIGVQEDANGVDDDTFQIGDGTTPGSNTFVTIDTSGFTSINGNFARKFTITTDNTNGAATHTAAEMAGGLIRRGTGNEITGDATDVTDTASNFVAGFPGCVVGSGYVFSIAIEDDTNTVALDGGTDVTMIPNDPSTAIPANATGRFLLVVTNATAASEAVSVYALGYSTH